MKFPAIKSEEVLLFAIFARNAILEDMTTNSCVKPVYSPSNDFLRFCGECFADELLRRNNVKNSLKTVDVSIGLCHDDACSWEVN